MSKLIAHQRIRNATPFFVILLASLIIFVIPDLNEALEFNRTAVNAGEWFRLITANLVHNNIHHLWLNLAGGVLIYFLFAEYFTPLNQVTIFAISSLSVGFGIYCLSDLQIYMGLSGYLHGLFAWALVFDLSKKRITAYMLAIGGIAKLIYERVASPAAVDESLIQITVAIDAHLYGVVAGVLVGISQYWYFSIKDNA